MPSIKVGPNNELEVQVASIEQKGSVASIKGRVVGPEETFHDYELKLVAKSRAFELLRLSLCDDPAVVVEAAIDRVRHETCGTLTQIFLADLLIANWSCRRGFLK
jgi:hypothetical protein